MEILIWHSNYIVIQAINFRIGSFVYSLWTFSVSSFQGWKECFRMEIFVCLLYLCRFLRVVFICFESNSHTEVSTGVTCLESVCPLTINWKVGMSRNSDEWRNLRLWFSWSLQEHLSFLDSTCFEFLSFSFGFAWTKLTMTPIALFVWKRNYLHHVLFHGQSVVKYELFVEPSSCANMSRFLSKSSELLAIRRQQFYIFVIVFNNLLKRFYLNMKWVLVDFLFFRCIL